MKLKEITSQVNSRSSYVQIYSAIASSSRNAYQQTNYLWTMVFKHDVKEIPKFYGASGTLEQSVQQWAQTNSCKK